MVCVALSAFLCTCALTVGSAQHEHVELSLELDFLLWPYQNLSLRMNSPSSYFPNAHISDQGLLDVAFGHRIEDAFKCMPGGLVVIPRSQELVDSLFRVAFLQPYVEGPEDPFRKIKLAVLSESFVSLHLKGFIDDNDYMTLGDYGNEYGEYRWGVFMRFIQRALRYTNPKADAYFNEQERVLQLPIAAVKLDLSVAYTKHESGVIELTARSGQRRSRSFRRTELVDSVRRDLSFALALHPSRVADVTLHESNISVTIQDAIDTELDFRFHAKLAPWTTWRSYFGPVQPQSLAVVAQTAREKILMVGDDLSDFYTGSVTSAVPEGKVEVSLVSPACDQFRRSLTLHKLKCQGGHSVSATMAGQQSVLYSIAAKEKLSGELGIAAESSLKRIHDRHKPWPLLAVLHVDGERSSLEILEGKVIRRGSGKSLAKRLLHGVDIVHVHSCILPAYAVNAVVPGGLILVEGLTCDTSHAFKTFMKKANDIGRVAVGRRIAVIIKKGEFTSDVRRVKWPHQRSEL